MCWLREEGCPVCSGQGHDIKTSCNNRLPSADKTLFLCKLRCGLFPETPLDSPARLCIHEPGDCECNQVQTNGFCRERILRSVRA